MELPITEIDDLSVLAYLTDEQAAEYFAVESHIGRFDIKVDERNGHFDEDELEEPCTDPEQPTNPDNPADTPSQAPEQPTEPPKDDTTDNPADTTPDTPQPPQSPLAAVIAEMMIIPLQ